MNRKNALSDPQTIANYVNNHECDIPRNFQLINEE